MPSTFCYEGQRTDQEFGIGAVEFGHNELVNLNVFGQCCGKSVFAKFVHRKLPSVVALQFTGLVLGVGMRANLVGVRCQSHGVFGQMEGRTSGNQVGFSGQALTQGVVNMRVDGEPIRVYSVAKTVADSLKYYRKIGTNVGIEALREGVAFIVKRTARKDHY